MVEARFRFAGRCVTGSRPSEPNPHIAPNFTLREFARQDGGYLLHVNLIFDGRELKTELSKGNEDAGS